MSSVQTVVEMSRCNVRWRINAVIPHWINVYVGMELNTILMGFMDEVGQWIAVRLPPVVWRWLAHRDAADSLSPWLGTWLVVGVCSSPNLEEDSVEARVGGILNDGINSSWIGRLPVIRPVKSCDPHTPKLPVYRRGFWR